jgi:hypothetical protein
MRRWRLSIWLACAGGAVLIAAGAAGLAQPPAARAAGAVLTVKGPAGTTRSYTLHQLTTGFPRYAGYAGYVKTGFVGMEAPHPVRGVRLADLLAKVGYKRGSVTLGAADGYKLTYSSKLIGGRTVTTYKASPPKYPVISIPGSNPLTAILAYQDKAIGARVGDSKPWRYYTTTYATDGSDGLGPLRFWWSYKKWADPGYLQIGWSSLRMVTTVTSAR